MAKSSGEFTVTGGANMYSVGELHLTAAVPEPGTYPMLMAGLGLVG